MPFAEKLDFLMNITRTSNSALAGRVALDASYISRLRSGKRLMPKNADIIHGMAVYFARHADEAYQKKAICDALGITSSPDGEDVAEELVRWLLRDNADNSERIGQFLSGISDMGSRSGLARPAEELRPALPEDAVSIYYGSTGKRRAAEYFLCEVAAQETPQTLLLFSDEDTSWMTDDPAFLRRWAELMALILSRGNRIKIIHTISRDLDEMLSAISQWMPLYMSGSIEPYFYPKKRDGIFKRTLFIAPETAAVVSNSVGDQVSAAANILYRDRAIVSSFAEEFLHYLRRCRPLMRIFTDRPMVDHYTIYAREELGVIVAKTSQPPVVLAMSESNMTAAFWDFLKGMVDKKTYAALDKAKAIANLRTYLIMLKAHCNE